ARADVVDERDRVVLARRPAAIDDFLRAALHLGIAALYGGEVEVGTRAAAADRGGGAAAEPDEHGRPAQHDELRAHGHLGLVHVRAPHVPQAAGDHDRLVVAAQALGRVAGGALLEGAEVAAHRRAAEFVVERGGADRALEHDLERGGDARRRAERLLPGALVAGDAQVRHREAGEPRLGFGAATGGALVADLPARAGRSSREGRDGGGMIVRLHLHENVDRLGADAVDTVVRVGEIARPGGPG